MGLMMKTSKDEFDDDEFEDGDKLDGNKIEDRG